MTTYTDLLKANFSADVFREYMADNFGSIFTHGGCRYSRYAMGMRMAKKLAKMIGTTVEQVVETTKEDYQNKEEMV